jgi:GNAT superfamily N-acetyltransferase
MQNPLTIGSLSFERVDSTNQNQVARVQKLLERAPRYYKIVEGVTPVPDHMAVKEIDGEPPNKIESYEKHFLLICLDGLPIGVADLHKDHPSEGCTYIGLLLFDEKYQGKGWGGKTYPLLENYCRENLGTKTLLLGVAEDNDVSDFWEKMGFAFNNKIYTWTGENKKVGVHEMQKDLITELPTGGE